MGSWLTKQSDNRSDVSTLVYIDLKQLKLTSCFRQSEWKTYGEEENS